MYMDRIWIYIKLTDLQFFVYSMQPRNNWQYEQECEVGRKKKYSKKGENVSMDQLGFRAKIAHDVIDPRNIQRVIRRKKPKYVQHNSKQNFLSRLRMVIDVQELPEDIPSFQFHVSKLSDWNWVRKVYYRSRQQVYCSICLQQKIIAPQITFCGHIFCFHCILMHFKKSQNSGMCPVCKQFTEENELKTCQTIADHEYIISDEISLSLKYRLGRNIYDSQTHTEDLNFQQIIRMRSKGILAFYLAQQKQLQEQLQKTLQKDRNHLYLLHALKISLQKIQKVKDVIANKPQFVKLREGEKIIGEAILRTIQNNVDQSRLQPFFQQKSGRFIFLHELCKRFLGDVRKLPPNIKAKIMQKQQTWYGDRMNDYKHLSHLNPSVQIDLVVIDIEEFVNEETNKQFLKNFKDYMRQKQQIQKRQQEQAQILNKRYEQEQKYIRKLKQMDAAQFQIKVPTQLDPSDLNQHSFPSLISENPGQRQKQIDEIVIPSKIEKKKTHEVLVNKEEDFPQLTEMKQMKSTGPQLKHEGGKRNKKKKQKKIDMTHLIFGNQQQED